MIELFHAPRSRSNRVVWLLEEMGLPYTARSVKLGEKPPELLVHNPCGTLPLMLDGDVVLFESVTIMEYLAETYGPTDLVIARDDPEYWAYRQLLLFGEATLAGPLNAIIGTTFMAPPEQKQNFTVDVIRQGFKKRVGYVTQRLAMGPYMVGDRFTLADISVGYGLDLALKVEMFGLKELVPQEVADYAARITDRPAYRRMVAVR